MALNTLTRRATLTWLDAVRLPLTAVERVTGKTVADTDTPTAAVAAAFGTFEVSVKETVGRLTRDETLQGLARLQRSEIAQRTRAIEKTLEAEAARNEVIQETERREAAVERQRAEAERTAAERERKAEQARQTAERRVAEAARQKQEALAETTRKSEQRLAEQAARADAERLRVEAEALRVKQQAVNAQGAVLDLDRAVKQKKAARKNG